jgi:hypothetical protein
VGLVKDHTLIALTVAELRPTRNLVIVDEMDNLAPSYNGLLGKPLTATWCWEIEVHICTAQLGLPLATHSKRRDDESLADTTIGNKTEGLDGLADTHLVSEDTTSDNMACAWNSVTQLFCFEHPDDPVLLVLMIYGIFPSGFQGRSLH